MLALRWHNQIPPSGTANARCNDVQRLDMATVASRDKGWIAVDSPLTHRCPTVAAVAEASRPPKPRVSSSMVHAQFVRGGDGRANGAGDQGDMDTPMHSQHTPVPSLVIFGGRAAPQRPLNDTFVFSLADRTWHLVDPAVAGPPPSPRWRHSAVVLHVPDLGAVMLVLGGRNATTTVVDDGCTGSVVLCTWIFPFWVS